MTVMVDMLSSCITANTERCNIIDHRCCKGIKDSLSILLAETSSASQVECEVAVCLLEYQSQGKNVFSPISSTKPPEVALVVSKVPAKSASG